MSIPSSIQDIKLTPSQSITYDHLNTLSSHFPFLVVQGERETGKHTIISKFLHNQPGSHVVTIDLCQLSLQSGNLDPSKFYQHLNAGLQAPFECVWIYIRHWDRIRDVVEDYGIEHRFFPRYAMSRCMELLSVGHRHLIVSTEMEIKPDGSNYWTVHHECKSDDVRFLLQPIFSPSQTDAMMSVSRNLKPGNVRQILTYISVFPECDPVNLFKEGVVKLLGSPLDPEETIVETQPCLNLIGMEKIIEAIETAIIAPIEFGSFDIPLKKGIVLAGPPGTGKTSIGRWLTYRLRGKLYLVDGSSGVSGNNLIGTVSDTLDKAYQNSPAVVFIDDVDMLFDHADTYRSFLTLLDGLQNKHRADVCVIVTVMDITKIPSSLIRGGRLELCLETQLPIESARDEIVRLGFNRMIQLLKRLEMEKKICPIVESVQVQMSERLTRSFVTQTDGWNCADIQRCIDDLLRIILSKGTTSVRLDTILTQVIQAIRRQYSLVRRPEEKIDLTSIYL